MQMIKRILAMLMAIMLVLGTVALADGSEEQAEEAETKALFSHDHLWSAIPSSDTATCTKDGIKTYKCINVIGTALKGCKEVKEEFSPAKGHKTILTATAKATCTAGATETRYCLTCGYTDVQTISEPLGHKWGDWKLDGEIVCGQTYRMTRTCSVCEKSETKRVQNAHAWGEWKITKKAKCETEGERTRQCANCDETQTEVIAVLGHNFLLNGLETVKPTCTEDGKNVNVCSRCLKTVKTVIPALGHDWGGLADLVATCTEPSFAGKRCERCGLVEYGMELGKPLGHDYQLTSDTSTCTLPGIQTYTCTHSLLGLCNDPIKLKMVPAKGHTCNHWETALEPTCTELGKATCVCEVCGQTVTRPIPMLGHDWDSEKQIVKPTCTTPGLVTDAVCKRCGVEASGYGTRVVAALGHTWDEGVVTTSATCGADGEKLCTCQSCGETKTEVIPATGKHNYKLTKVGFMKYKYICTVCGAERD